MSMPLEDLRILDFTQWVAGPEVGVLLSLMGAQVIKIENHERPDPTRDREQLQRGNTESSALFSTMNVNKLGVTIDLKKRKGVELALRLTKTSDAVTENFRPRVMDKFGLSFRAIQEVNERIVMLSISGFGQTGPDRENAAFASVFGAVGGLSHLTGYSDGPPVEMRIPMDFAAGASAAMALLAGLAFRDRTGKGTHIDVSASAMVSSFVGEYLLDFLANGRVACRKGNHDEVMAPHNCYPCEGNDRWVSIAIGGDEEWAAFCRSMEKDDWLVDERFSDGLRRYRNQGHLDQLVAAETVRHSAESLEARLQEAGVAATIVASSEDICRDPHLRARRALTTVDHPVLGRRTVLGAPWKLSGKEPEAMRPAPMIGQHNEYVFGELLGLGAQELAELRAERVIC